MSADQFAAFAKAADHPREREYGPIFVFLGKTGVRPSEAIAPLPSDIDEGKRKVRINKVYLLNAGRMRPYTKTGVARPVDLSTELCDLLLRHRAQVQQEWARRRELAFKEGKPVPKTPEMLFPNRAGNQIDSNNAADAFHRICRKANIGRFRPYALRHTFATLHLAQGAPTTYVASQLLHVLAHFGEIFSHGFSHGIQAPQQTTGRLESILATEKVHSSPVCSPAAQNLVPSSFRPR